MVVLDDVSTSALFVGELEGSGVGANEAFLVGLVVDI